jgi:hypothetical protein
LPADERDAHDQLLVMAEEEREALGAVAQHLARQRVALPPLGSYPMAFTNVNYLALDHVLRQLIDYQREALSRLQQDEGQVQDAAARDLLGRLIETKQRHQQTLDTLASAQKNLSPVAS